MEAAAMRSQPAKNRPDAYWPHHSSACVIFHDLWNQRNIPDYVSVILKKKVNVFFKRRNRVFPVSTK